MGDAKRQLVVGIGRHAHWLVLLAGAAVCIGYVATIAPIWTPWFDELCTLFFSDPAGPLERTFADTHPPLYYMLTRLALSGGLAPNVAFWGLNALAIFAAFWFSWRYLHRIGYGAIAIAAFGVILVTPGTLRYLLEGRNYTLAQFACVALAAAVLVQLEVGRRPRDLALLAGLSALCAAVHTYAGLFAGSIGGALVLVSLLQKNRGGITAGLVIGGAASLVTIAWLVVILPLTSSGHPFIQWLSTVFNAGNILSPIWFLSAMIGAKVSNFIVMAIGVTLCAFAPAARGHAVLFVATLGLFILIPVVVSLVKPMLTGRYLAISSPALILMIVFVGCRAALSTPRRAVAIAGTAALGLFAVSLAVLGPDRASESFLAERKPYQGQLVSGLVGQTRTSPLRVMVPDLPPWGHIPVALIYLSNYRYALNRADIELEGSHEPARDVADYPSGLIGWNEDQFKSDGGDSINDALKELNLTNRKQVTLRVENTIGGYLLFSDGMPTGQ